MRIYENDKGEKFVETGRIFRAHEKVENNTFYLWLGRVYSNEHVPSGICYDEECAEVRPATPEEVAASEGKKMCPAGCGAGYATHSGQSCPWKQAFHQARGSIKNGYLFADAHWREFAKPEKKDEKESQARAAEDTGCRTEALPVTSTGCTQLADSQEPKPAAPPAILDTCACCRGKGRVSRRVEISPKKQNWNGMDVIVTGSYHEERDCPECNAPKPPEPEPDTRPDIVQRDARSDSFVWRRDWRVGR